MAQTQPTPLTLHAEQTRARIRRDEARRAKLRKAGVRTPLTRAELAAQAARSAR